MSKGSKHVQFIYFVSDMTVKNPPKGTFFKPTLGREDYTTTARKEEECEA